MTDTQYLAAPLDPIVAAAQAAENALTQPFTELSGTFAPISSTRLRAVSAFRKAMAAYVPMAVSPTFTVGGTIAGSTTTISATLSGTATTVSGFNQITASTLTGGRAGDILACPNFPIGTKIRSGAGTAIVTLDQVATASGSGVGAAVIATGQSPELWWFMVAGARSRPVVRRGLESSGLTIDRGRHA